MKRKRSLALGRLIGGRRKTSPLLGLLGRRHGAEPTNSLILMSEPNALPL